MICEKCDKKAPPGASYCPYCGKPLSNIPLKKPQRMHGTGSVFKRGRTWRIRLIVGWKVGPNGEARPISKVKSGFKTKVEAEQYLAVLRTQTIVEKNKAPTLRHYWNIYSENDLPTKSKDKIKAYKIAWRRMESLADRPMDTIKVGDVRRVVAENTTSHYPARDMKTILNKMFELAAADGYVNKDIPSFIILPALNEKEREPFTVEEQKLLWKSYEEGNEDAAWPLMMIYTGMMPGELKKLLPRNVDLEKQMIIDSGLKTETRKESPIFLPSAIVPVFEKFIEGKDPDKPVLGEGENFLYDRYYAALDAAGCKRREPYCCRHTTATALAIDENVAPQTVQRIMRWASTRMLDRYAHPDDAHALEAIESLTKNK